MDKAAMAEYRIWNAMRQRCGNPNNTRYYAYGGRGIRVCERWEQSFLAFYADMGPRPGHAYSLDRYPNNDGNYEPNNCRWATLEDQRMNSRRATRLPNSEAAKIIAAFGGGTKLSRAIGVDVAVVSRWMSDGKRGTHGEIPPRFVPLIMTAAKERGIAIPIPCAPAICPTCGRSWRKYRFHLVRKK